MVLIYDLSEGGDWLDDAAAAALLQAVFHGLPADPPKAGLAALVRATGAVMLPRQIGEVPW